MKVVVGVSPENAASYDDTVDAGIRACVKAGKVQAMGPCGLVSNSAPAEAADAIGRAFHCQVAIAREFHLPLIVEANGAHERTFGALEKEGFPFDRLAVRAFNGTDDDLRRWVEASSYVSFGADSANSPMELRHQVELVAPDRVLVESGAPEQTLDSLAGYPARCDQVVYVAEAITSLVPAKQLATNASEFFRL